MVRLTKHWVLSLDGVTVAAKNFDSNPLKIDFADDDNAAGFFDRNAGRALGRFAEISLTTEAKSTGVVALGTPISQAALFKAAGFEESLSAGVSSAYALTSNPQADRVLVSALEWFFGAPAGAVATLKHTATNVVFDLTIRGTGNSLLEFDWKGLGRVTVNPTEDVVAWITEIAGNPIRVLNATITGEFASPLVVREFEIATNNENILPINAAVAFGRGDPIIVGRDVTYRIQVQEPDVADADFWDYVQTSGSPCNDAVPLRFIATLGGAGCTGDLVTINGKFKMSAIPERVDVDGIGYYNIVGKQTPNDALLTLTFA